MHTLHDFNTGALAGARHVSLTHQGLTTFPRQLFDLADTLEVLDLSGNQLSALPDDLPRLHRLRVLFASHNPFTVLPPVLGQCPQLEMVGFKACQLQDVPPQSLPPRLRWLILTDNRLRELPATLGQRPRLQKLMLACNQLSSLPDLHHCPQLELVRLASNRLPSLPTTLLRMPALAWLAIGGNPFTQEKEQEALVQPCKKAIFYQHIEWQTLRGEGASGQIWQALHGTPPQPLAIKRFKAACTSDGTPQSEMAAGLWAGQHPHLLTPVAPVQGMPAGALAMALPLLPSTYTHLAAPPSLDSCTRDVYSPHASWSAERAQQLLGAVRSALQHLHARGVLHGDVYAHNVLWQPDSGCTLLSDLGAATLTDHLPAAQVAQLQAMEWRAFAHLQAEVLARVVPKRPPAAAGA